MNVLKGFILISIIYGSLLAGVSHVDKKTIIINKIMHEVGYKGFGTFNSLTEFLLSAQESKININTYKHYWIGFKEGTGIYWKMTQFVNNVEIYQARFPDAPVQLTIGIIDNSNANEPLQGTSLKNALDIEFIKIANYTTAIGTPHQILLFKRIPSRKVIELEKLYHKYENNH